MLYPQNGDGIVTTDCVTSLHAVHYVRADKPYFPSAVPVVAVTEENALLTINVTARANPADITYRWSRGAVTLVPATTTGRWRQDAGGAVMTAAEGLRRDEAGVYTVEASNSEGSTTHDVNIDVHCEHVHALAA